jgi:uncharacterized damage-inducible protein DinB
LDKTDILLLYDYNYWANQRVLQAAGRVTIEQFLAPARLSQGSLRGALVHAYGAERIWRQRIQGASPSSLAAESEFPSLQPLLESWALEEIEMRACLTGLAETDLPRVITYQNTKGRTFQNVLWQLLVHVVNHGTHTRGEAGLLLEDYGQSPGDLDLILYLRERAVNAPPSPA